jgi:uncharacterized protein (TIGR02145 family)
MLRMLLFPLLMMAVWPLGLQAQKGPFCDPAIPPSNLSSTYTPGVGAQLTWDVPDGSEGVRVSATIPGGGSVNRTIIGFERTTYLVPDAVLTTGQYVWQVRSACSTTFPFDVSPISGTDTFTVGTPLVCPSTVTDASGNTYNVVKIGEQCWMQENLATVQYSNGDSIARPVTGGNWQNTTEGALRPYNNDMSNVPIYGYHYNFLAVEDPRNVCPTGWHVPSLAEWDQLDLFLGGPAPIANVGGQMRTTGDNVAGTGLWNAPNDGATNSSGFSGLPGGFLLINAASLSQGASGRWWSSDVNSTGSSGQGRSLSNAAFGSGLGLFSNAKNGGENIRCVQD